MAGCMQCVVRYTHAPELGLSNREETTMNDTMTGNPCTACNTVTKLEAMVNGCWVCDDCYGTLAVDEQAERIKENVAEYYKYEREYSYQEFEDMFEDRDPFEFL